MAIENDSPKGDIETVVEVYELHVSASSGRAKRDHDQLARLGKKSVLKRHFSFMSILGFSCTVLITWEVTLIVYPQSLLNGGPAGVVYSFLVVWFGNACLFATLSELASLAPTSGGQYHWVSMLAPRSCAKFLSYVTGWLALTGWQGITSSVGYLTGTTIQGLIALTVPSYNPQPWQGTLLLCASVLLCVLVNGGGSSILPKIEGMILVLHILGFCAVLVTLLTLANHNDVSPIFTTFYNGGGWPNQGLSFMVGLMGNVYAIVGVDSSFHMSEEVKNPSITVPRSVMTSIAINGVAGFAMVIAILLAIDINNIEAAMTSRTGFPFMDLLLHLTGSMSGSAILISILIIMCAFCSIGVFASSSRVMWSFARDRGLPFWRYLSKVDPRTSVPLGAIAVTTVISCLLALINIGSTIAFNVVVALSVSGVYSSYLIVTVLLLYRRCTGALEMPDPKRPAAHVSDSAGKEIVWGPWHIPGICGIITNVLAIAYLIIILTVSCFPPVIPVQASTMNYSSIITGSVTIFSVVYYMGWARKVYQGPIVEI